MGGGGPPGDSPQQDTSEQIYISSLALIKMLKHGRAGVPLEVMGLMLGEFVDEYTVKVVDVFAMPQSGTGVSVEAVDPVFQTKMLDMLKQVGRYVAAFFFLHTVSIDHQPSKSNCTYTGPRWSSGGTTPTQASAVGSQASTSTPNKPLKP